MDMDDRSYLRMRRKQLNLKLQDVADYLQISRPAVSMFESYKMNLTEDNVKKYYEFIQNNSFKGGG